MKIDEQKIIMWLIFIERLIVNTFIICLYYTLNYGVFMISNQGYNAKVVPWCTGDHFFCNLGARHIRLWHTWMFKMADREEPENTIEKDIVVTKYRMGGDMVNGEYYWRQSLSTVSPSFITIHCAKMVENSFHIPRPVWKVSSACPRRERVTEF